VTDDLPSHVTFTDYPEKVFLGLVRFARQGILACALIALVGSGLAACTPDDTPPSPPSASVGSPTPSPLTQPGQVTAALDDLIAAAGSAHAIKVELDAASVTLSVVIGQVATTWAWRDGVVAPVESDTAYVGQAIFDPRTFNLAHLDALLEQAEAVAGSNKQQRLHIVEYADGHVYMTVTTNPESVPVFFRADGSLIEALDLTTAYGLGVALSEATAEHSIVIAIGLDPATGGLYADARGVAGQIIRTLRMPQLPPRNTIRQDQTPLTSFDPHLVRPQVVGRMLEQLPELTGHAGDTVDLVIDCRDGEVQPAMYFTVGNQVIKTSLAGVVLPI
jgi:hypothetical protein